MAQEKGIYPVVKTVSTQEAVKDVELTEEEAKAQMRMHEEDFIQGLIDAADYAADETQRIEIVRDGKVYFAFSIRPLSEEEYNKCKKNNTRYVRNRQFGMKLPEETNSVKYRSSLIYQATVEEDRKNLWDNKRVWEALRDKGLQIVRGLDVIEYTHHIFQRTGITPDEFYEKPKGVQAFMLKSMQLYLEKPEGEGDDH